MKKFQKKALALMTTALLVTGISSQAHAGAIAYSHLLIDNFQIFKSNDVQYDASDFTDLNIGNFSTTFATNTKYGTSSNDSVGVGGDLDITPGSGQADDNASCEGSGCDYEDSYMMQSSPLNDTFVRGDTQLLGALITGLAFGQDYVTADALSEGQTQVTAAGSGFGNVGTSTQITFTGIDDTIEFNFNAEAIIKVLLGQDDVNAYAALGFTMSLVNDTTGNSVSFHDNFLGTNSESFAPVKLNRAESQLSTGEKNYDDKSDFSATTVGSLVKTNQYTLTINQGTNAKFNAVVPEPSALALFGMALIGLAASRRRKTKTLV